MKDNRTLLYILVGLLVVIVILLVFVIYMMVSEPQSETPEQATAVPTTAPTAEGPTPTPIPGDPAAVLGDPEWLDTFDNADSWTLFDNQCFKSEISDGKYAMTGKGTNMACWEVTWPEVQNYYLEALATPVDCQGDARYGLFYRAPDTDRGYLYGLTCEGKYGLYIWDGESGTLLTQESTSDQINPGPGQTNRIGVIVEGTHHKLYVNGVYIDELSDASFSGVGRFGFFSWTTDGNPMVVDFDNMGYWNLP